MSSRPILVAAGTALLLVAVCAAAAAQVRGPRDTFNDAAAGNDEVARTMREFKGRGAVGDDSLPTAPDEAVRQFVLRDGLEIQLLAHEPAIAQPLFMTWDERGRLWLVQYRQYPFPAGLKIVRYDRYLRAVFDRVPDPPPHGVKGADAITVCEDTDGDGRFDSFKNVIEGLNICSAVAVGGGGIWVLNPPYLLFYPDADRNDVPDADPEVRLRGFGIEDTHAVANSLKWGPDGWLYGANGSTTTARVCGGVREPVAFEGQCIWRYHPLTREFEIYAEGGGNTFSLEIDGVGRVFSGTNHGETRGMHYPQGSYGEKNWGKHGPLTNPYAFGFFRHMRHEGDQDRFSQTFLIYEGGLFPPEFAGRIVSANALHNRIWVSDLVPDTSTYRTVDLPPACSTTDRWFRPVDVEVGPDGGVYVADWYDSRLTHVDPRDNWHTSSGRLYRIQPRGARPLPSFDLAARSADELVDLLGHGNKWFRQQAVRVLAERGDTEVLPTLRRLIDTDDPRAVEALWATARLGGLDESLVLGGLAHRNPHVRRWTARLVGDARRATPAGAAALARLATTEPDPQVRSQLASTAKRLPADACLPIVRALVGRGEDMDDRHLPLLVWWAVESKAADDRESVLALFADPAFWSLPLVDGAIVERIMRRYAMGSDAADLEACGRLLALAPDGVRRERLVAGFLEAFRGRAITGLPATLTGELARFYEADPGGRLVLGLRLGIDRAIGDALAVVADGRADEARRIECVETLGQLRAPRAVGPLLAALEGSSSRRLQRAVLEALMPFDDPRIGPAVVRAGRDAPDDDGVRATAWKLLASRPASALLLLHEVDAGHVPPTTLAMDVVQGLSLLGDPAFDAILAKHWGSVRPSSAEKQEGIARVRTLAREGGGDPAIGKAIFTAKCGTCHRLFGGGGGVGPDLTGYERTNLDFLVPSIIDPSGAIREEYTNFAAVLSDGRTMTGLIADQDARTITLRGTDGRELLVNRDDVEELQAVGVSLMPENLLTGLDDSEIRALFAYLMARSPDGG